MAVNLKKLNVEQNAAVTYGEGPLLIVAGAGTGKTTVITERVAYLIENKFAAPEEILAVTFTEKAADEMEERVDRLLSFGYLDLWISTFHAFCERILRENGLDIGLPANFKLLDQTAAWLLVRKNLDGFNLDYYRPLGNPTKFIHALLNHFSRCKDQVIYPEDYLKYADDLKSNLTDLPEGDEEERIKEIASSFHVYQRLLLENSFLDFGDLINYCLILFRKRPAILNRYRQKFKYILVDEFQDTNWAQYELIKTLAAPLNNLTVCADDDQCLPGNTWIAVRDGERKIREIKKGDEVLTAVGRGHIGISKVKKVFRRKKTARLLNIRTKAGLQVQVTDNHKMFCFVPSAYHHHKKYVYVYLMHRQGLGWRMGVTNDLITRLKLERSADKILALRAFSTETEARYHETLWSLKYGIPTSCFQIRKNIVIKDELLTKLYQDLEVENNIQRLAQDLNIDLSAHHFCLEAINRGRKVRIKINLRMCHRNYRSKEHVRKQKMLLLQPLIKHVVILETSDKDTINILQKAGFCLKTAKRGMKLTIERSDIQGLGRIACRLQALTGGIIENKFNLAVMYSTIGRLVPRSFPAIVMPAKNLVLGHFLPIRKGREIVYDEIIGIEEVCKDITVYDLEIEKTHNFFANGVVVHNSVYKWRGASVSNINQFINDFSKAKKISLVKNYRSCQNILDLSHRFIQANNPNRLEFISKIDKRLLSQTGGEGIIKHLHFKTLYQEADGVAKKIIEILEQDKDAVFNDFAILVRANDSANPFSRALERAGLPYQFLASRGLYFKPVILDIISYFKLLDNYHESAAVFRVLNLPFLEIPVEDIMKLTQHSYKKAQSLFETLSGLTFKKELQEKTIIAINKILSLIKKHLELAKDKNVSEIFVAFLKDSGYLAFLLSQGRNQDLDFIAQFYRKIKEFEDSNLDPLLKHFMAQMNLEMESEEQGKMEIDPDQGPDMVKIMTIHGSKGLEFKYVFLASMVDRKFPSTEKRNPIEIPLALIKEKLPEGDIHLQEERRLCYVALTRAKKGLFLTSADDYGGQRKKKISQFFAEMGFSLPAFQDLPTQNIFLEEKPILKSRGEKIILPDHFSFTQLMAFAKCPYQYKLAHILRVPIRSRPTFTFGKSIHNTLYEFLKSANEPRKIKQEDLFGFPKMAAAPQEPTVSINNLLKIYDEQWIDEWFENKKQKQRFYQLGREIIKRFYRDFTKNPPKILRMGDDLALEREFNLKIGSHVLRGKIDRIDEADGGVRIIDYKTGHEKEKLRPEDKTQLLIYQIAAEEIFGLNPIELCYCYVEDGSFVSFLGSMGEKEKQKEKIAEEIDQIQKSNFEATPGWDCRFCDFREICSFADKSAA